MAPFGGGGFLGPFPPNYSSSFLKFRPEVVSYNTKTVSEQSFEIKHLIGNGTYSKLKFLENPKYCQQKTKFSQKLNPYDYQITQVPGPR